MPISPESYNKDVSLFTCCNSFRLVTFIVNPVIITTKPPVVTAVQCPAPENPKNGKAIFTSFSYNSVVSYECNYGFMLVGESSRRCGADKKWSGQLPSCKEINCGHPGQLYNGWLEMTGEFGGIT